MMLNRCSMIGRLAKDPQIKETASGSPMAIFDLVVGERLPSKPGVPPQKIENTFRVIVLNKALVTIVKQYVFLGSTLFIEGRLQNRKFPTSDGGESTISEIVLGNFRSQLLVQNRFNGEMGAPMPPPKQESDP